ncbi:hypothetical protein GQX74_015648, partial [Glossina fuscipes]
VNHTRKLFSALVIVILNGADSFLLLLYPTPLQALGTFCVESYSYYYSSCAFCYWRLPIDLEKDSLKKLNQNVKNGLRHFGNSDKQHLDSSSDSEMEGALMQQSHSGGAASNNNNDNNSSGTNINASHSHHHPQHPANSHHHHHHHHHHHQPHQQQTQQPLGAVSTQQLSPSNSSHHTAAHHQPLHHSVAAVAAAQHVVDHTLSAQLVGVPTVSGSASKSSSNSVTAQMAPLSAAVAYSHLHSVMGSMPIYDMSEYQHL